MVATDKLIGHIEGNESTTAVLTAVVEKINHNNEANGLGQANVKFKNQKCVINNAKGLFNQDLMMDDTVPLAHHIKEFTRMLGEVKINNNEPMENTKCKITGIAFTAHYTTNDDGTSNGKVDNIAVFI